MHVFFRAPRSTTTFRTASDRGLWRVSCDGIFFSAHWSEGDARRDACLAARRLEAAGVSVRVMAAPDIALRHNEPQFGR